MVSKIVVKTTCMLPYLRQFVPWHRREIMVFIMVTHIKSNSVQYAIIAMRFLFFAAGLAVQLSSTGKIKSGPDVNPTALITEDADHPLVVDRSTSRRPTRSQRPRREDSLFGLSSR